MADLHYRDNVYGNQAAIHGFGQSLRNAMLGAEALRLRQQQEAQQAAYQQQQIMLHRQQLNAQMPLWQAQQAHAQAQAQGLDQQRTAGQDLGFNLQQYQQARSGPMGPQDADLQAAIMSRIMQQQGVIAAAHPATIGQQVPEILQGADPRMQQLMATKTHVLQPVRPGGTLYDASTQQPLFTAPGGPSRLSFDQQKELAARAAYARMLATQNAAMGKVVPYGQTPPNQQAMSSFVQQAIQGAYGPQVPGSSGADTGGSRQPIFAKNPKTGDRIQSLDGGSTWAPASAPSLDVPAKVQQMPVSDPNAIQAPSLQYNQ